MIGENEKRLLGALGEIFAAYNKLPQEPRQGGHNDDITDFRYHIHRLQDLIAARSTYRQLRHFEEER